MPGEYVHTCVEEEGATTTIKQVFESHILYCNNTSHLFPYALNIYFVISYCILIVTTSADFSIRLRLFF